MVIICLLLRQRVNLNYQHIFLKNNSSGLGRVPGMAATFQPRPPDQRYQHQVEEDRQPEKGESPVSVPGQPEGKEEKQFRRR
jgi:hypothetical protein